MVGSETTDRHGPGRLDAATGTLAGPQPGRPARRTRISKPAQERLEDLLAAVESIYAERGVADATVAEITERAGVAKGTFYLYFPSKQHALAALWERYVRGLLTLAQQGQDSAVEESGPGMDAFVETMVDYALAHRELHRIVYRAADATALQLCRDINQQVIDQAAARIRRGTEAGLLACGDPALAARILYHGAHETLHDAISGLVPLDRDRLVAAIREATLRTLGPLRP